MGFWNKRLGILGALGSCFSFVATVTIIPFMPDGWAASAGGFPAMTERVAFLMKDLVLLAGSFYLLKQDLVRALSSRKQLDGIWITGNKAPHQVVVCMLPEFHDQLRCSRDTTATSRTPALPSFARNSKS